MPFNRNEALLLRETYQHNGFFCGVWLGGCGRELCTRIGHQRVPHFAHNPENSRTAVQCRRVSTDERSADHLYLKRDLPTWLRGQGHSVQTPTFEGTLPREGGVCTSVRVPVGDGGLLMVALSDTRASREAGEWARIDSGLRTSQQWMDWLFADNITMAQHQLSEQGYAFRLRLRNDRGNRLIEIGTQARGKIVRWADLADCKVTEQGLWTPHLDHIRSIRKPTPASAATPAAKPPVGTAAKQAPAMPGFPLVAGALSVMPLVAATSPVPGPHMSGHVHQLPVRLDSEKYVLPTSEATILFTESLNGLSPNGTYRLSGRATLTAEMGHSGATQPVWTIHAEGLLIKSRDLRVTDSPGERAVPVEPAAPAEPRSQAPAPGQEPPVHTDHETELRDDALARIQVLSARLEELFSSNDTAAMVPLLGQFEPLMARIGPAERRRIEQKLMRYKDFVQLFPNRSAQELHDLLETALRPEARSSDPEDARRLHAKALDLFSKIPITQTGRFKDRLEQLRLLAAASPAPPRKPAVITASGNASSRKSEHEKGADRSTSRTMKAEVWRLLDTIEWYRRRGDIENASRFHEEASKLLAGAPREFFLTERGRLGNHFRWIVIEYGRKPVSATRNDPWPTLGRPTPTPRRAKPSSGRPVAALVQSHRTPSQARPAPTPPVGAMPAKVKSTKAMTGSVKGARERTVLDVRTQDRIIRAVPEVAEILRQTAEAQSTIRWDRLVRRLSAPSPGSSDAIVHEVLLRVDKDTAKETPLWTALLVAADHRWHPAYESVSRSLGRPVPSGENGLVYQWNMEVLRLHQKWRNV